MAQEVDIETPTHELLFDDLIPLPFKILFIIQFGTFLWFSLVYIFFNFTNINVLRLLDLSYNSHNYSQLDGEAANTTTNASKTVGNAHEASFASSGEFKTNLPPDFKENNVLLNGIWNNLKSITLINFMAWSLFKLVQYFYEYTIEHERKITILTILLTPFYYILPISAFLHLFYKLFYKSNISMNHKGQYRIYTTMTRILAGGINSVTMRTNDILISDSLTSYSKVINDFGLFFWNYYYSDEVSYNIQLEFVILCIPIFIRIKQCWYEYNISKKYQHLLNLLKYTTGLGPLLINLLIKYHLTSASANVDGDDLIQKNLLKRVEALNNWWYFFSFINSAYSFVWDVKMDWNLELFDSVFDPRKPFNMLRSSLAFKFTGIYLIVIVFDFIFRFVWVLKLFIITDDAAHQTNLHIFSTFLFGYDVFSFGYTVLETIEIIRRWLWCFIKLEADWVKLEAVNYIDIELASSSHKREI